MDEDLQTLTMRGVIPPNSEYPLKNKFSEFEENPGESEETILIDFEGRQRVVPTKFENEAAIEEYLKYVTKQPSDSYHTKLLVLRALTRKTADYNSEEVQSLISDYATTRYYECASTPGFKNLINGNLALQFQEAFKQAIATELKLDHCD